MINAFQFCQCALHIGNEFADTLTTITSRFSSYKVVGLNGRGALINGCDAGITQKLCSTCFLYKAHAAVHLNTQGAQLDTHLG